MSLSEKEEIELKTLLVRKYGNKVGNYYPQVTDRIDAVIGCFKIAGSIGENPMCKFNRAVDEIIAFMED